MNYFKQACELAKKLDERVYPGMYQMSAIFKGENGVFNCKEMSSIEVVNKATLDLIHQSIQCRCFSNGSWLTKVKYSTDLDKIENQTEEDYFFDMTILNLITTLKVLCNEAKNNPNDVYFVSYDTDTGLYWVAKNEEIEEQLNQILEEE